MKRQMHEDRAFKRLRPWLLQQLHDVNKDLSGLTGAKTEAHKKNCYRKAREHYKQVEFFVEYCSPREAKFFINGALVPKHDDERGRTIVYPNGFQKIEEFLFAGEESLDTHALHIEVAGLVEQFRHLYTYYETIEIHDAQLLEMCQLELFRIAALNLNGYDATVSLEAIEETSFCMNGLIEVMKNFAEYSKENEEAGKINKQVIVQVSKAAKYLRTNKDYNSFQRLQFIVGFINPINASIVEFHNSMHLPWSSNKHAVWLNRPTLFARENFNTRFFSMYYDDTTHIDLQATLGKLLFSDPVLSSGGKMSCASCHNPGLAFTDTLVKSRSLHDNISLNRNTPSLWNVVFQKAFFADGRAYQLEQQVFDVVHNKDEMGNDLDSVVEKLKSSSSYRLLFAKAFEGTADATITPYAVKKAITEYESTLIALNSVFDNYVIGNGGLTDREINGYNIFAGKALCGSCHFFPLMNGTVPPFYTDTEFEVIGTPDAGNLIDEDPGRYRVTGLPEHKHAFKTPGLRKIQYTAPYMHNGVHRTLEQVLDFYQKGGGRGMKLEYPNQTLPFDSLQLSNTEKEDIILFLKTL